MLKILQKIIVSVIYVLREVNICLEEGRTEEKIKA